jgi:hypothetical protein
MADAGTHVFRVSLDPKLYRDVEIRSSKKLYDLAAAIVAAFGFYFDHPFGFYSLLEGHIFSSPVKYELFADLEDIGEPSDAGSVERTPISEAFPEIGHKMTFLFDYGHSWQFQVELIDRFAAHREGSEVSARAQEDREGAVAVSAGGEAMDEGQVMGARRNIACMVQSRECHDLVEPHGTVTRQPLVLGRDLPGLVGELPRGIGEDGRKVAALREAKEVPPRRAKRACSRSAGIIVPRMVAARGDAHVVFSLRHRWPRRFRKSVLAFHRYAAGVVAPSRRSSGRLESHIRDLVVVGR